MKITAKVSDISFDYSTGKPKLTITVNEKSAFLDGIDEIKEELLSVELKKYRPRRSLDANAFAWLLMGKLAENQGIAVSEIYRHYIREVGNNSDVVCVIDSAVDKLREAWEKKGMGWVTEKLPSKIDGCTCVMLYYGSSVYDTKQMSKLIDLIVQDCKALGIETATPEELSILKERWH